MLRRILSAGDWLLGSRLRYSGRVQLGRDTRVQWRSLSVPPGNRLVVGDQSLIGARVLFESDAGTITIGNRAYIGRSTLICHSMIEIGDDVVMSWGVTIVDHNSHSLRWSERSDDVVQWARGEKSWTHVKRRPVRVRDKVWVGFNVSILMGVTIGEGAVIGAGSVVRRDVPPWTVVAGNPAVVIKELSADER